MSISNLTNAPWLNIKCNNVVSLGEINGVDIIASNLQVDNMTVNEGFALSTMDNIFPQNGTQNQVLSTNGQGLLSWTSVGGGGTGLQGINTNTPNDLSISESSGIATIDFIGSGSTLTVSGTINQINAVTNNNICILSLPTQVSINTLDANFISVNNEYQLPTVDGQASQVLSTNGSGSLSWVNQSQGTTSTVTGTANEITVSEPTSNNYVISLPSTINTNSISTQNLNINNAYNMPSVDGLSNQVLSTNGSGILSWVNQTGGSSVTLTGSSGQIVVTESSPDNYIIGFPPVVDMQNLVTSSLNINNAYNMPTSIGLENQILSVGSGNNLVWSSGGGTSGVNSITAGDNNIDISGTATNPTISLANQITLPVPATTNSFLIVPSTGASYAKIGTDALNEDSQSAQLLVSNEDRDVYGSLALNYNVSPELQNATLTLKNNNTVAGVNNSTTIISANGGINLSHSTSTYTTNITAEQFDMVDSSSQNTTSIVQGQIFLASGNDNTAISGTGVVFHSQSANAFTMPPNRGTANQVIQIDNPSIGSTKWATIGGGGNVTITGTTDQIAVTEPTNNDFVISLPPSVNIGQLSINSAYNLPTSIGAAGDVLTVPTSGTNLQWLPNVNVMGTTNEISVVERTTNNFAVGLPTTVDINTLNVGSVNVNSAYNLPTSIGQINDVLSVGPGTNLVWAAPSAGSSYTNTDNNLVINNTNHTINTATTINLAQNTPPYLNSMSPSQIQLSDPTLGDNTIVYPGSLSLYDGNSQKSLFLTGTSIKLSGTTFSLQSDLISLTPITFGFGTPGVFQFYQIGIYGNIYSKWLVFYLPTNLPILCQGTSGTFSSQSFVMPAGFGSILANGSGVNQVIGKVTMQMYTSQSGSMQYMTPGCIKLYNEDGVNYQLIFTFDAYYNQDFYNFQNGNYYTFWDKHSFPNDNPMIVCPFL
jgi:hypothetical protein